MSKDSLVMGSLIREVREGGREVEQMGMQWERGYTLGQMWWCPDLSNQQKRQVQRVNIEK